MKNIATAFVKAKKAFSPALKEKTNPAFRSKYADLGACLEAVNDALLENGIALYQETHEDASGVTVETVLLHETGESIRSGKLHVPAAKQDPQGYGSALTYARRYSLMAACGIAPEDDDGNAASRKPQEDPRRAAFLADTKAAIEGAANAGELKRIVAETVERARSQNDLEAVTQIDAWATVKASKARRPDAA